MIDLLLRIIIESWQMLKEASPFMLFGLLAAGVLRSFIPAEAVAKHLGTGRFGL